MASFAAFTSSWGSSLLTACWQGALLIVSIAILCRLLPNLPAGLRAGLWWLACLRLLVGLVPLAPITLPVLSETSPPAPLLVSGVPPSPATLKRSLRLPGEGSARASSDPLAGSSDLLEARTPAPLSPLPISGRDRGLGSPPSRRSEASELGKGAGGLGSTGSGAGGLGSLLFAVWLLGVAGRMGIGLIPYGRVRRLLGTARVADDPHVLQVAGEVASAAGMRRAPTLLLTIDTTEPLAVSHWNHVVLLSQSDFDRLSDGELRAVLAHEFAHLRRADLWLGLVPFAADTLFWFFPFAWLAVREFVLSREAACDALALHATRTPTRDYGQLLLKLGTQNVSLGPTAALGATSDFRTLQRRIIMLHQSSTRPGKRAWVAATLLFVPVVTVGLLPWRVTAQMPPAPKAQVAQAPSQKAPSMLAARQQTGVQPDTGVSKTDVPKEDQPINLDFAQGMTNWNFSSHTGEQNYFDNGLDKDVKYQGVPSPYLLATSSIPKIYGVVTQWVPAEPYRGKRVRFSGFIKMQDIKDYGGLMLGIAGGKDARNYLRQRMPVKGNTDWTHYEYVADIDKDARYLVLGINLQGRGKVWMNHLAFEVVGKDVPVSPDTLLYKASEPSNNESRKQAEKLPHQIVNADFAKGLTGWQRVEEGDNTKPEAYRAGVERKAGEANRPAAFLTSDGSQPNGYGTLIQYLNSANFRGKRIRFTARIKTRDVGKYAGLWIGQNGADWTVWDAKNADPKAPTAWTDVSLVCNVPASCDSLGLGVMVRGAGKLWVQHLALETVGSDVPTSPVTLRLGNE